MNSKTQIAKLAVDLVGDRSHLKGEFDKSTREGQEWGGNIAASAKIAAAGISAVVTAGVAAATMIHNLSIESADIGLAWREQAEAAKLSVTEMQAAAYAFREYNIEADKGADILKDVRDRIGEALATDGGGQLKDFLENVGNAAGLTAEKLREMSGPDALIAMKKAMDDANVSADEQVFYFEAIASDASRLMPLLAENGRLWRQLAAEKRGYNDAITSEEVDRFADYKREIEDMETAFKALTREAVRPWVGELEKAANYIASIVRTMRNDLQGSRLGELREEVKGLEAEIKQIESSAKKYGAQGSGWLDRLGNALLGNTTKSEYLAKKKQELLEARAELGSLTKVVMPGIFDPDNNLTGDGKAGETSTGSSGDDKRAADELQRLQEQGARKLEVLQSQFESETELARSAHDKRLLDIEQLQLSEQELARTGHETMDLLKDELRIQSQDKMLQELQAIEQREQDSLNRRLEQEKRYWQQRDKERKREIKLQEAWDKQLLAMQLDIGAQGIAALKQHAKEGSAIHKAMVVAEKGLAIARILINTEVAAMRAMAEIPAPANIGYASAIRTMGGISAGIVAGTAITEVAGIAHGGLEYVPKETTYLLDKGERVLSPRQNADLTSALKGGGFGGGVTVIVNEAEGGSGHDIRQEQTDEGLLIIIDERIRSTFNEDVGRGTGMAQTLEHTYGLGRRGVG